VEKELREEKNVERSVRRGSKSILRIVRRSNGRGKRSPREGDRRAQTKEEYGEEVI